MADTSSHEMANKQTTLVSSFLRSQLTDHLHRRGSGSHKGRIRPLIVGLQGPQGSGKTTLTRQLVDTLGKPTSPDERPLRVAVFSVDDLYLPFAGLQSVAQRNPGNVLLEGRGQPGTHDIELGSKVLSALTAINEDSDGRSRTVSLPIFDKSQNDGRGDRSKKTVAVNAPLDLVLFEGWCLGFRSLQPSELDHRYLKQQLQEEASAPAFFIKHPLAHIRCINENLRRLEAEWYPHIDAFVQLIPTSAGANASGQYTSSLSTVFDWRLQAEHDMKAANGGKGMSDQEVHTFVERYMPGYELFSDGVTAKDVPWKGRLLRIGLDEERQVTFTEQA